MRFSPLALGSVVLTALCLIACSTDVGDDDAEVPVGERESEESELVRRSVMIDADDNNKTVSVAQNQKFTIKLAQNSGSSGYRWSVKSAGGFGEAERRTTAPPAGRVGGTGWDYFSWNVGDKTGTHTIELRYARSWESGPPAETFKVKIEIQNAVAGRCGGLAGLRCTGSEWCDYSSSVCGRFDQMGRCTARPRGCRMNHEPVCGCNYRTYSNSCLAHAAGVDISAQGSCPQ